MFADLQRGPPALLAWPGPSCLSGGRAWTGCSSRAGSSHRAPSAARRSCPRPWSPATAARRCS